MESNSCCTGNFADKEYSEISSNPSGLKDNKDYETLRVEKTKKTCSLCESFAKEKSEKKDLLAVISCEGACLRGEVSRRVANALCFEKMPDQTARICLGSAITKDTGQRNIVRSASRVVILEGCTVECASRMIRAVLPEQKAEVIHVDNYYKFNKNLFGINEANEEEIRRFSEEATSNIYKAIRSKGIS